LQNAPLAIVLDGNQRSALATVRSLGRRGIPVAVAEAEPRPLAASSKYCKTALECPDPAQSPDAYVQWLHDLNVKNSGAVLMPMTDVTTPLVMRALPRLTQLKTALPSLSAYETASDKFRLHELAQRVGVRVPATRLVSRSTASTVQPEDFRFPVVVKPRQSAMRLESGTVKRGVSYAFSASELKEIIDRSLLDESDELLLQEYVTGRGAGVFGLFAHGEPQFFFAHRRIRERPPSGGVSVLSESVSLPEEGIEAAKRLLAPLNWHGVAMIEFKVDEQGRYWLIEINARLWGSLQLAVDSGADFPWFLYQLATAGKTSATQHYAVGRKLRWWLGDLDSLYLGLRGRDSLARKLRALAQFALPWQPGLRYEFLRWSDPLPALAALRQYTQALLGQRKSI